MEFKTIPEILVFSISKEQASIRFYQNLLSQLTDSTTKSLFKVLIQKEQEHIELLQLEIEKLGLTVDTGEDAGGALFRWDERIEAEAQTRDMNFVEALLLAIQKERAAFRLYATLIAAVKDEELVEVLMELAEEEMRHVLQLEREYESITHPHR
jgi:rubrerythrin